MNPFYKNLALWLVISIMMIFLFNMFSNRQPTSNKIAYSEFINSIDSGEEIDAKWKEYGGDDFFKFEIPTSKKRAAVNGLMIL